MDSKFVLIRDDSLFFNKDSNTWVESGLASFWKTSDDLLNDINNLIFTGDFNSDNTMHVREVGFIFGSCGCVLPDFIKKHSDKHLVTKALAKLDKTELDALRDEFRRTHNL